MLEAHRWPVSPQLDRVESYFNKVRSLLHWPVATGECLVVRTLLKRASATPCRSKTTWTWWSGTERRQAAAVPWRPLRLQRMLTFNGANSESNRVLDCGTNAHFQWYFMARRTFGGIFRFSHSFDAMKPIFPLAYKP